MGKSAGQRPDRRAKMGNRGARGLIAVAVVAVGLNYVAAATAGASGTIASKASLATSLLARSGSSATSSTVWLCRPGQSNDPCASNLQTTVVQASGATSIIDPGPAKSPKFDCFYVYPTVSRELTPNADLRVQKSEIAVATAQAAPFSRVCRVFAPMYRQVTLAELGAYPNLDVPASVGLVAYNSLLASFDNYLANYSDGRPIVFIGHSQGAVGLIELLSRVVDNNASLRGRLVIAIILGGDVEVRAGSLIGGSFSHIPACSRSGEAGCVIAYSSFPSQPPASALFGRPGQGVALQSGQKAKKGLRVLCVNPAALHEGAAELDPLFPSEGTVATPWVEFPDLYTARCETAGGARWLQVTKATGSADRRPVVTEDAGPDWGYHTADVNLALGNLVADVFSAGASWESARPKAK
jgi:hypothetical protein